MVHGPRENYQARGGLQIHRIVDNVLLRWMTCGATVPQIRREQRTEDRVNRKGYRLLHSESHSGFKE